MKRDHVVLWVGAFLVIGIWLGLQFRQTPKGHLGKLELFFEYLDKEYVDTLDLDVLVEDAMAHILSELDPHSTYIPFEEGEQMAQRMQGNFQGIGIEFIHHNDSLVVVRTMPGGPSEKAGLHGGDRIYSVDGDTLVGEIPTQDYTEKIKGPAGSTVDLGIVRAGQLLSISVKRGIIPLESVSLSLMNGSVGYIKLERFAETTHEEVVQAMKLLSAQGMRALILDLRDNPGGYLHEATAIADEFLSEGQLIVETKYRDGQSHKTIAEDGQEFEDLPLHLIINGNSASASEVLTGALQDHNRAIVYGERSYGKGLVQEDKELSDGSKVRLTVAYYYTPNGRTIQQPYEGSRAFELQRDGVQNGDSLSLTNEIGGIAPDVYLDHDTSHGYFWGFSYGTMDAYAFEKVDHERKALLDLSEASFIAQYSVSDIMLLDFLSYGGYGLEVEDLTQKDRADLRLYLKAIMAKNLWGFESYQKILLEKDQVYQTVQEAAIGTLE